MKTPSKPKAPRTGTTKHISELMPVALAVLAPDGPNQSMPLADAPAGHTLANKRPGAVSKATR